MLKLECILLLFDFLNHLRLWGNILTALSSPIFKGFSFIIFELLVDWDFNFFFGKKRRLETFSEIKCLQRCKITNTGEILRWEVILFGNRATRFLPCLLVKQNALEWLIEGIVHYHILFQFLYILKI